MIAFRYTKTDGAEYLSHLDLMRHIMRTMRRAGIELKTSEGFHKHPRLFLNNPLALGVRSVAEYGAADTDFCGDFKGAFNSCSPAGIKCLSCTAADKKPNYANGIVKCSYEAYGINAFGAEEILNAERIVITDLRGRETDIRPKIFALECGGGKVKFTLGCGENNLRPDLFCAYLAEKFGGSAADILKTASFGENIF